jgi:putative FmdB family regulatory protein
MPVYEYECKQCHREFEYQQRMSDPEKTVCESCGGELARIISRTAFQLKGSGWYKDLYGSAKPAGADDKKLPPGHAPAIGAHEGGPTGAELNGTSVTSDGKSANQLAEAHEKKLSAGTKTSGSDSGGGSSSSGSGGGSE